MPASFVVQQQPATVPFNRRWHIAKIVTRGWSALLACLVIILAITLTIELQKIADMDVSTPHITYYFVWLTSLVQSIFVLFWDVAEFITLCIRRKRNGRGIHPAAHVAVDLILWLSLLISWSIFCGILSYESRYSYDYNSGYIIEDEYSYTIYNLTLAIVVFLVLLSLIHFFLFVRACVETDQYRRARKNGNPIMFLPTGENGGQLHFCYSMNHPAAGFQPTLAQLASFQVNNNGSKNLQPMITPVNDPLQPPPKAINPDSNPGSNPIPMAKTPDITQLTGYYAPTTILGHQTPHMGQTPPHPSSLPPLSRSPNATTPVEESSLIFEGKEEIRPGNPN